MLTYDSLSLIRFTENFSFSRVKFIYVGSLTLFGISMFLLATFPTQLGVLVLSVPAGIIYSTMLTIPFLLMTKYHGSELVNCGIHLQIRNFGVTFSKLTAAGRIT